MSAKARGKITRGLAYAAIFAALGDETRLRLVAKLSEGEPLSISQLTQGSDLTRQAVTKHLKVLERAGLVAHVREGRASLFEFKRKPFDEAQSYLSEVSAQWNQALSRLKRFVES